MTPHPRKHKHRIFLCKAHANPAKVQQVQQARTERGDALPNADIIYGLLWRAWSFLSPPESSFA